MPHLIPYSQRPPQLSIEKATPSDVTLGHEYFLYYDHPDRPSVLTNTHQAIGRLATSTNPTAAHVRRVVDDKFRADTLGIPDSHFVAEAIQTGVVEYICSHNEDFLADFLFWHQERAYLLRRTIQKQLPALQTEVETRAQCLADKGLLPTGGVSAYNHGLDRVARAGKVFPIDSFDSSIYLGMVSPEGLFLSHLFKDGYQFGEPADEFWHVGMHEAGHLLKYREHARNPRGNFSQLPLLEEIFVEHLTAMSSPKHNLPAETTLYDAANVGYYSEIRKLFGLAYLQCRKSTELTGLAGEAITGEPDNRASSRLVAGIIIGFSKLYPEHGLGALSQFMDAYTASSQPFRADLAKAWHDKVADSVS